MQRGIVGTEKIEDASPLANPYGKVTVRGRVLDIETDKRPPHVGRVYDLATTSSACS